MMKLRYAPVFIAAITFVCLAFWPGELQAGCDGWPDEVGYDTIPYSMYAIELYLPPDTTLLAETLEATGPVVIWRGSYDIVGEEVHTEILDISADGVSPSLGGSFSISLDADAPASIGIIEPCDTTCEMATGTFEIHYVITTTMAYPMDTIRGSAQMELQEGCFADPGWNPMATGRFLPPYGHTYEDPRKVALYDNSGAEIGYARHRHELPMLPGLIPSLTTWGIIILTILIIVSAGYIIFRRRRNVTA